MREHKVAAVTAGALYITGTVAGIASRAVTAPVRGESDVLTAAANHADAVRTGALLVLLMGLALAFIPVVLFPVLRKVNEALALGYLVLRGAIETVCYVGFAIVLLLLVPTAETVAAGPGTASPTGVRLGDLMDNAESISAVLTLVFCLGAGLFYVLLYQSRIVPRWIASWGLAAIPFYAAGGLLAVYAVSDSDSTTATLLDLPLAVQEMTLAVWMIARGFRPASGRTASGRRESSPLLASARERAEPSPHRAVSET
jgi:hypothetical protein